MSGVPADGRLLSCCKSCPSCRCRMNRSAHHSFGRREIMLRPAHEPMRSEIPGRKFDSRARLFCQVARSGCVRGSDWAGCTGRGEARAAVSSARARGVECYVMLCYVPHSHHMPEPRHHMHDSPSPRVHSYSTSLACRDRLHAVATVPLLPTS